MKDLGLLILRLTFGSLMAGHGAQKLFGWFGGHGMQGTAAWLESMNMRPGKPWAALAGGSEFGGGLLTLLGFLNPLGPLAAIGAMGMAAAKAHAGKPIWNTAGGAELPALNIAMALSLALMRPGKYSLDRALGVQLPRRPILIPGLVLAAGAVALGVKMSAQPQPAEQAQPAAEQAQAEQAQPRVAASTPAEAPESPTTRELPQWDERSPEFAEQDLGGQATFGTDGAPPA